jgi:DNA polymerase-3 subunit delta'
MIPQIIISNNEKLILEKISQFKKELKIPDNRVFEYREDGTVFKIETLREIVNFVNTTENQDKIIVLYNFDLAKIETQNTFLKTLEEKNAHNLFVMVSKNRGGILETILSRCKIVRLENKKPRKSIDDNLDISKDQYLQLLQKYEGIDKEKAMRVCDLFLKILQDKLKDDLSLATKIKEVMRSKRLLEKNNINAQMTIDHIIYIVTH